MVNYLTELLVPLLIIAAIYHGSKQAYKYLAPMWVEAEANQWMVIIKNGNMVRAGVGLKTFKMPFQQVVKFPSQVHNVSMSIENVTKEMQGVEVSANLVWSIYRDGNGPFLAYKNLGADLMSTNPRSANENLTSLANGILRNQIANSTIDDILRNRSILRNKIREEMGSVVKGWGIWLETVEITDVRISSASLFKDLQASYREEQNRKAEVYTMQINNELQEIRNANQIVVDQKQAELDKEKELYIKKVQMEMVEDNMATNQKLNQIDEKRQISAADLNDYKRKLQYELQAQKEKLDLELSLLKLKIQEDQNLAYNEVTETDIATRAAKTAQTLKKQQRQAEFDRSEELKDQKLTKESQTAEIREYNLIQEARDNISGRYYEEQRTVFQSDNDLTNQVFFSMMNQKKIAEN